jgi:Predicted helicase
VIENYQRLTPNKKAIAFCPTIASSMELCNQMQGAGINAKHLDSTMDAETRKERLKWLKVTPNAVLCNVGIFNHRL